MGKVLAALALGSLLLAGDHRPQYIVGDPTWLATKECSFSDPMQCALEAHMKAELRKGPVKVE